MKLQNAKDTHSKKGPSNKYVKIKSPKWQAKFLRLFFLSKVKVKAKEKLRKGANLVN